jgi:hypothetical protein
MMQTDYSRRIHQYVPAPLMNVSGRFFRESSPAHFFYVGPPGCGSPEIQDAGIQHAVSTVYGALLIHKQRPPEPCLLNIVPGENVFFESDDGDFDSQTIQLVLMTPQLRQVPPTRQSAKVTVEDQQQPGSGIVLLAVRSVIDVPQLKRNGFFPYHVHVLNVG